MIPNVASPPSSSSVSKPTALSIGTLIAACAAVFIATVGLGLPAAITGVMQQTLHASGPQLSWISEAFLVPTATLGLTFGVLGDLYGRKRILVGGAALMAIGYAVCAIGVSVHALYVGQALSGVGAAACSPRHSRRSPLRPPGRPSGRAGSRPGRPRCPSARWSLLCCPAPSSSSHRSAGPS